MFCIEYFHKIFLNVAARYEQSTISNLLNSHYRLDDYNAPVVPVILTSWSTQTLTNSVISLW